MNKTLPAIVGSAAAIIAVGLLFWLGRSAPATPAVTSGRPAAIRVVAAENFYGDIAKQLGGDKVDVTSILSDPNVDPHEYESSVQDGIATSNANLVIANGRQYDTWMDKLLSASPNAGRRLITVGATVPVKLTENPHVWYGVENAAAAAESITADLRIIDPADAPAFDANLAKFNRSLLPLEQKIAAIKSKYGGTPIGLTETIYLYQTEPMGLNVLTPFEFEKAIAEGNDPSADSVKSVNQQVTGKQIKILIYNRQTITPITTNLLNSAMRLKIPTVPVSETMPAGKTYQTWMFDQMNAVEQALGRATR